MANSVIPSLPIDHLVVLARELDHAIDDFERMLGVRATMGGRHHAFGTHNAMLALGEDCYLELIALDPAADRAKATRRWPFIPAHWYEQWRQRQPREEPQGPRHRLVNFALSSHHLSRDAQRATSRGLDPGEIISMSRLTPDGARLNWKLTFRNEAARDGLVPFLIDWGDSPHPARSCPQGCRLIELHGEHPEPAAVQRDLAAIGIAMDVRRAARPALIASIDSPRGRIEIR